MTKFVILNERRGGEREGEERGGEGRGGEERGGGEEGRRGEGREQRTAISNTLNVLQLKWWDDKGQRIKRIGREEE